jgi:hypothetical protein
MAFVVANPEFLLDQVCNPRAGPQRSLVAQRLGPSQQQPLQSLALRDAEPCFSSGAPSLPQPFLAPLSILRYPAHNGLAGNLHTPGHLGLVQQADGLEAALLQRLEIASHSDRVSHTRIDAVSPEKVTLYYARVNKYVFPPERGELVRGVPTSYAAEPLYKTAPIAALRAPSFYEYLVLADALRDGRVRERETAERELCRRLREANERLNS